MVQHEIGELKAPWQPGSNETRKGYGKGMCIEDFDPSDLLPTTRLYLLYLLFFLLLEFFQDFCLCVPVFLSACYMWGYLQRPEDVRTPGTGITSSCETPDIGAGNQTWVPWESCECLQTPAHPVHPTGLFLLVIHWVWTRGWINPLMKSVLHDLTSPQQHHQPGTKPWGYFIRTSYCLGRVHLGVGGAVFTTHRTAP